MNAFNWQRPPVIGIKPKRSRAKVRTRQEQHDRIMRDNALSFNVAIYSAEDSMRNARIDGRHVTLGR